MEKLHPKAVWLFFIRFIFTAIFILLFIFYLVMGIMEAVLGLEALAAIWSWLIVAFILYIVFCYIWARLTYRFWRYESTKDTLKIERGVIWKKYISIPYGRIQNVDIYRGLIDRLLGLSDLQVQTAGYSGYGRRGGWATEGRLPGLDPKVAEELRENLIGKIKGTSQGL